MCWGQHHHKTHRYKYKSPVCECAWLHKFVFRNNATRSEPKWLRTENRDREQPGNLSPSFARILSNAILDFHRCCATPVWLYTRFSIKFWDDACMNSELPITYPTLPILIATLPSLPPSLKKKCAQPGPGLPIYSWLEFVHSPCSQLKPTVTET